MLLIKYYTKVLCTENYTQMHICLDEPEVTKEKKMKDFLFIQKLY